MPTSPHERFRHLFANIDKPELPNPTQVHIVDRKLGLAKPEPADPEVRQSEIPDVPQVKREFRQSDHSGARNTISSLEDKDDYVNACKSNAKSKVFEEPTKGGRKAPKPALEKVGNPYSTRINLPRLRSDTEKSSTPSMRHSQDFKNDAMQNDTMQNDAMQNDAMQNDAMQNDAMQNDAMQNDAMQNELKLPTEDVDGNKATGHFCVLSLVAKFPYKYMKDPNDQVSKRFFAYNKFYEREWDLYYLNPPQGTYAQPIILLPVKQVKQLLSEISANFKISSKLPPAPFTISFFNDNTPQPLFLGKTRSREGYNELSTGVPPAHYGHGQCPEQASEKEMRAFEDFRSKCEEIRTAKKKGKTPKQEKKTQDKLVAMRQASGGLRRIQRYFGLRPKSYDYIAPDQSLSCEDQQKWELEQAKKTGVILEPLNIDKKAPHPFEKNVVIIAFDVEANEHAHHLITEVGVSTLDTDDIKDIAPGPGGDNWIKKIRSRHFRIKEHAHMRNKTFVSGNPDGFDFGSSEFVGLRSGEAANVVDQCFTCPFSQGFQHDGTRGVQSQSQTRANGPAERRVVLLGHDIQTDIDYLSKLGSKIFTSSPNTCPPTAKHEALKSVEEALDIAVLYKVLKKEDNPRSLGSVMSDLGRDPWGLHNGGNDARYTMECLVGLAVKARLEDDVKINKELVEKARLAKMVEAANAVWSAPNAKPGAALHANADSGAEAEAINAPFLDPARTLVSVVSSLPPGKGRHYGSDNELEEVDGDEDDFFSELAKAVDEKLKLEAGNDNDDDDESEFEM